MTAKLPTRKVAARYNSVPRTIDRWVENPDLSFPQPTYINGRKYWDEAELDEFDRRQAIESASRPRRRVSAGQQAAPSTEAA